MVFASILLLCCINIASNDHLYQVGEDYIYVEINTTFPDDTLDVFNVTLVRVYICTFDPLYSVPNDPSDMSTFGCINSNRDDYDEFFHDIYDKDDSSVNNPTFSVDGEGHSNVARFSFQVPYEVARDTLYVQAELFVALQELGGLRGSRRLMAVATPVEPVANQIQDFVENVGINHGQQPKEEPQQPQQPRENPPEQPVIVNPVLSGPSSAKYTINLSSPWVITLGGLLGLILTFNIVFMTYKNCWSGSSQGRVSFVSREGTKKGYSKVNVESEYDSEAQMIQNDDDESQ